MRRVKRVILVWLGLNALGALAIIAGGGRGGTNDHPFIRNGGKDGY